MTTTLDLSRRGDAKRQSEASKELPLPQHRPLSSRFEAERARLLGMAQRMLGSAQDAEDVLQEAWIRLQRCDRDAIANIGGWLTTVVSRLAIDRLRARANGREDALDPEALTRHPDRGASSDPEQEAILADSVGIALLVVLDRLRPPERVAFVLHDLFAVPFQDVASVLDCSPEAARQFASRARRSIRGTSEDEVAVRDARKHALVSAFFVASRGGDLAALLRVLDADIALTVDPILAGTDRPLIVRGAETVAKRARLGAAQQLAARVMLIDGEPGIVVAPAGKPRIVMTFEVEGDAITRIGIIADPQRLAGLALTIADA